MWWFVLSCAAAPPDLPVADGFDFPVGPPDATGYYDAQPFGRNTHLGEDWNGLGGGHSDRGDPVFAVATGLVTFAEDVGGGWGKVVRVVHRLPDGTELESLYAHLGRIEIAAGGAVRRGERIGTIGDAGGLYWAHLHLELRDRPGTPLGAGYGATDHHVAPTPFIRAHRPPP